MVGLLGEPDGGRRALLRSLVGRQRGKLRGTLELSGKACHIGSPLEAIRHGLGLITQRRKSRGLVLEMSLEQETFFSALGGMASGFIVGARERDEIDLYVKDLGSPAAGQAELWKWLHDRARIVLLEEPTRGVAPGARRAIRALLGELAGRGCGCSWPTPSPPSCQRSAIGSWSSRTGRV